MTGRALEQGGNLIQRVSYAAPRYDLKFSRSHGADRDQNKNRSEQDVDRPFAHDAPFARGALCRRW